MRTENNFKIFQFLLLLFSSLPWPLPERQAKVFWPPTQNASHWSSHWTDENRHVCKACNWSRGVDCLMTISWRSYDCLMAVSWLSHDCLITVSWLSCFWWFLTVLVVFDRFWWCLNVWTVFRGLGGFWPFLIIFDHF